MHRTKVFILAAALCLCILVTAFALTDGVLAGLWNSGSDFLFHTDNVTVTGKAVFSLDGTWFKTAELNYIQDGCSSYYGLKLLTPRKSGYEQETGWIIIADEEGSYAVMEAYEPGVYRMGTGAPQNTLLRRSVQLDALVDLGGLLAAQVEGLLPEGAVTATEADGMKTVHIAVSGDQIPEIAVSGLNMAARFLSDRWFGSSYDNTLIEDEVFAFDRYITVTQALTDGTVRWALKAADADFTMDAQGRLTAVNGTVTAASTYWDGTVREVAVQFELAASDYGTSSVKPFDPADYGVMLPLDYYGEEAEEGYAYEAQEDEPWEEEMYWADAVPLPAYAYSGSDAIEAAVAAYTANIGETLYYFPEGAAAVPAPVILKTEALDDTHTLVYGNFWVFNYMLDGKILECVSGGEAPGIMLLTKTETGWDVTLFEEAGDGTDYEKDIRRFCQGDKALEEAYFAAGYGDEEPVVSVRLRFLREYAAANSLDVKAYQDYGWDPVRLHPEEAGQPITALASEINPEHVASVLVNARITGYLADENALTLELIVPELYDGDEVTSLIVGDSIYTQGQEVVIETLDNYYGYVVINGGDFEFSEGSVWLYELTDGTFAIADWDDNTWITLTEMKAPVQDFLLFLDCIDPSSGEMLNMPIVHGAAEFVAMLQAESEAGGPGFATNNVYVAFDAEGRLALVERYYVPWQ